MSEQATQNRPSPVSGIDTSFQHYVDRRKKELDAHMNGTVPDYAFDLDYELRSSLDKIPHFYSICKKILSTIETREMEVLNQTGLQVGPRQYPEIYEMGVDCAHRLGIAVPNIFIKHTTEMNAYTIASDMTSPLLVLYTGIVERMTPAELKAVIAHECGHIHNQHLIYQTVINQILSTGAGLLRNQILSMANLALMQFWTRAAEVTADRAAMICVDRFEDAYGVNAKLASGGTLNDSYQQTMDMDAIYDQLSRTLDNPTRILEITRDHPSFARRIFCEKEFSQCEVLYRWRPEMQQAGTRLHSKAEADLQCRKLVNILKNKQ